MQSCDSTNDLAVRWARNENDPAKHGDVVVADRQEAGRGRQGRHWHSPPGDNLYASFVLRPTIAPNEVPPITLCAGLAIAELVNNIGVPASIKWPNDILVGERKLAGILTEMATQGTEIDWVVVGIGVNLNTASFPADLRATSLFLETQKKHDVFEVLGQLSQKLLHWTDVLFEQGFAPVAKEYRALDFLAKRRVRALGDNGPIEGIAQGITAEGGLEVADDDGLCHHVRAGEVTLWENEQ